MKTKEEIKKRIAECYKRKNEIIENNEIELALDFINIEILTLKWVIEEEDKI